MTTSDLATLVELEAEVRELRNANAILKTASAFLRRGARPPVPTLIAFIDAHHEVFGVERICRLLTDAGAKIAPSTYYAARDRPASARAAPDEALTAEMGRVHQASTAPARSGGSCTVRVTRWPAA